MTNSLKVQKKNTNWFGIIIKSIISLSFLSIFLCIFFVYGGERYFYAASYVDAYSGSDFAFHVIDVAQGDCFLIKLPGNKTLMIDSGDQDHSKTVISYIKQYMKKENVNKIDYFVMTHADSDHIGGGASVLKSFDVENLYRPKVYSAYEDEVLTDKKDYDVSTNYYYDNAIKMAYSKNVNIVFSEKGITIQENGYKIEFLSPAKDKYTSSNDYSACIMLTVNNKKFLLMGDASTSIERKLIQDYGDYLKADVLKVAHHGSNTSTSDEFVLAVKPEYSIISVNRNNSYSLPSEQVTNKLYDSGSQIISTAKYGSFAFGFEDDEIEFSVATKPQVDLPLFLAATILLIFIAWNLPIKLKEKEINKS